MLLLDGEFLPRGKAAQVSHVGHQLVVLHPMVDVGDEHLLSQSSWLQGQWLAEAPGRCKQSWPWSQGCRCRWDAGGETRCNVIDIDERSHLVGQGRVHPHLVCWHPTQPDQGSPTYDSEKQTEQWSHWVFGGRILATRTLQCGGKPLNFKRGVSNSSSILLWLLTLTWTGELKQPEIASTIR